MLRCNRAAVRSSRSVDQGKRELSEWESSFSLHLFQHNELCREDVGVHAKQTTGGGSGSKRGEGVGEEREASCSSRRIFE